MQKYFYLEIFIFKSSNFHVVHFTAQTRFSLITESSPARQIEVGADDYACLQDNRGSFNPYCSLREDDADFVSVHWVLNVFSLFLTPTSRSTSLFTLPSR